MSIIKVKCTDQVLTFENTPVVASGGLEEDFVQFSFCSQWDGYARTAVFWRTEDDAYHVVLDEDDSGQVPPEVTADEGVIYFGVFGVNTAGCRRTSEVLTYRIVKGAITTGTKPSEPTQEIYTQLLADYAEVLNNLTTFNKSVTASASAATSAQNSASSAQSSATTAQAAATAAQAAAEQIASEHASRHSSDGVDPVTPAMIGAPTELRYQGELAAPGWYQIATFSGRHRAHNAIVFIGNGFYYDAAEGVTLAVCMNERNPAIVILGASGKNVFTQFRIGPTGDASLALEVYYAPSEINTVATTVLHSYQDKICTMNNFREGLVTDPLIVQSVETVGNGSVLTTANLSSLYGTHNKPTAADVGARSDTWTPSASDVGAIPEKRGNASLSAVGWYRIATFDSQARTNMALVMFGNNYQSSKIYPQGVSAMVNVNNYQPSIVILSSSNNNAFSKLRLVNIGTTQMALEAYYTASNTNNVFSAAFGIRAQSDFTADNFTASTAADDDVVLEQDIRIVTSGTVLTDHRSFLYRGLLTSEDDLDAVIDDGVYVYGTDSPPLNAPFPNASVVLCIGSTATANQRIQLGFRYGTTGYCRFRGYSSSKYQAWADVYTSISKPAPADIGAIALSDKPSGTYTGNNAARAINTGGVGNVLLIVKEVSEDDFEVALVHPFGCIWWQEYYSEETMFIYRSNYIKYENGILTISGVLMNHGGGTTYNYYCL